jgi:hypothetical protein
MSLKTTEHSQSAALPGVLVISRVLPCVLSITAFATLILINWPSALPIA